MSAEFQIQSFQFNVMPMRTRFPFKYGIASMVALPHLFVTVELIVNGKPARGLASEGLPPKWFTKDPTTLFEQDLAEMLAVIKNAARLGENAAEKPVTFFAWWRDVYDEQANWAAHQSIPPLLSGFGVSLVERAVLDGLCKALGQPLHRVLASDELAIDLGNIRPSLQGMTTGDVVKEPLKQIYARHTIGLGDPLRTADILPEEKLEDGLPHSLEDSIRAYGLKYFKIKVCGKPEIDQPRLRQIAAVLGENCGKDYHCTFDGNEQFYDIESFLEFYRVLSSEPHLKDLFASLILIEQPLHRSQAMEHDISQWKDGPPMIIDESDGSLGDLPRALELGYKGTSHKNCKGIIKSIANAALLKQRGLPFLSGEDLCSIGPVAMLQDLAMSAALGVTHVERNGHHYFKGLSIYPEDIQTKTLAAHPGFYAKHRDGFPVLQIEQGLLNVQTLNAAPFGCGIVFDAAQFEPLNAWIKRGGMGELG